MKRRLFSGMCLLAVVTLLLSFACGVWVMYRKLYEEMRSEVKKDAMYLAAALNVSEDTTLTALPTTSQSGRITLIAADGTVLFDDGAQAQQMENHLNRPEVQEALQTGYGESTHVSTTMGEMTFYVAIRLDNGEVLRMSNTVDSVLSNVISCIPLMLVTTLVVLLLSLLLAKLQTKRIVVAMNELNLENPLANDTYEELSPLLGRIEKQNEQIKAQMESLSKQKEEFISLTENMSEGLIMVGATATVLTINRSAMRLLGLPEDQYQGRHIFSLDRSLPMQAAVTEALDGQCSEKLLEEENGRALQLMANPIWADGKVLGVIVLLLDVTERRAAEQMRREFSANVSHELKTPLTSISGYAEIMKNGLVRQEDMPRFLDRIYTEARRLIALIEDIIKLSHLDENTVELPREPVELLALSKEVVERLAAVADSAHVTITVEGDEAVVTGVRQIIDEMIFNLVDNAIKYNKENGHVYLTVENQGDTVAVTVQDTGIGIPNIHQERVFQRFYRVDKSHSKETGGTGLGLSIVKHGAQYHNAKLTLESTEGVGTTIKIMFQTGGNKDVDL